MHHASQSSCILHNCLRSAHDIYSCIVGRAGLLGADEAIARLREEARLLRERAAEARSRLQSTHVSNDNCVDHAVTITMLHLQNWYLLRLH